MATLRNIQDNVLGQVQVDLVSRGISGDKLEQLMYTGLLEEAGEVAGIYKRRIRQEDRDAIPASREHLFEELGDVLWYFMGLCVAAGFDAEEIWSYNVKKLEKRYGRDN